MYKVKPWGSEEIIRETDVYVAKLLCINPGQRLSLQYHMKKVESMVLVEGAAMLELGGRVVPMQKMHPYLIKAEVLHRVTALQYTEIIEVSTPELDDIVRVEDDYGRAV